MSQVDEHKLQSDVTTVLNGTHRDVDMTPWQRIAQANQMALEAAKDPYIRHAAVEALKGCHNIRARGAEHIAKWLRKNITYSEEALGVEVLQGPFTTLALRSADCDDLAITWCALTRACGLDTYVAGVASVDDPNALLHAVGYDNGSNTHWELSKDYRWGGPLFQPLVFKRPTGYLTVWWSPEEHRKGYWVDRGNGYERVQETRELPTKRQETMRIVNPYDAKGQWYDESTATTIAKDTGVIDSPSGESDRRTFWRGIGGDVATSFTDVFTSWLRPPDETLAELPPEEGQMVLVSEDKPGVPTWVWGILGLGAIGGLVWYAVKQ